MASVTLKNVKKIYPFNGDDAKKKKKKKVKGGDEEEKPHRPSIFGSLYRKIAGIMDDDGDEL